MLSKQTQHDVGEGGPPWSSCCYWYLAVLFRVAHLTKMVWHKDRSSICTIPDRRQWENLLHLHQHVLRYLSQAAVNEIALFRFVLNLACLDCWQAAQGQLAKMPWREVRHVLQTSTFSPRHFGVGFFFVLEGFWERSIHSSALITEEDTLQEKKRSKQ